MNNLLLAPPEIRGLSLVEPWATAIVRGLKLVETRSWATPYRGLVAIHASRNRGSVMDGTAKNLFLAAGVALPEHWPFGCIVAVATLWDIQRTENMTSLSPLERIFGDYTRGRFGWVLREVKKLERPIPARGMLGLWRIPKDPLARVREAIA